MVLSRGCTQSLDIETGRHEKPRVPPELRLCKYYESEAVGYALHFLIHCDFHSRDRQILLSLLGEITDNFYRLTDSDKFIYILTSPRHDVILALGKLTHDGFEVRDRVYRWICKLIRLLLIFIISAKGIVINSIAN